jgi:RNA polymerase sigma-70 factor (ECF subfamily)
MSEARRLRDALTKLPDGQQAVISMHWFQDLSFIDIAEILGLSHSAVKVRAHRGYQRLRQLLKTVTEDESAT